MCWRLVEDRRLIFYNRCGALLEEMAYAMIEANSRVILRLSFFKASFCLK